MNGLSNILYIFDLHISSCILASAFGIAICYLNFLNALYRLVCPHLCAS